MKISALPLICFIYLSAGAQETLLSIDPEIARNEHKRNTIFRSHVIDNDPNGMTAIMLKDEKTVEYMLLNKAMGVVSHFSPSDGFDIAQLNGCCPRYGGGTIDNGIAHFFYYVQDKSVNKGKAHLRIENVDFKTKTIDSKYLFDLPSNEYFIQVFTERGLFYLISCNDKTSEIIIKISDVSGKVEIIRAAMNLDGFAKDKVKLWDYLTKSRKFSPGEQNELSYAADLAKIYPYEDKIIVVVAKYEDSPDVWTIDKKTSRATGKPWELNGFYGYAGKKEKSFTNSFLYQENLFVFNQSKEKLEIAVFNMVSGQIIKKYDIDESTNPKFIEPPMEYIRIDYNKPMKTTITSNKQLIKEISKGSPGIAVSKNKKGELILTCGAYDRDIIDLGPSTYVQVRKVNFRIAVDPSTFDLIATNSEISALDKLCNYFGSLEENTKAINIFRQGDRYFLSAYDWKLKKFSIVEIAD